MRGHIPADDAAGQDSFLDVVTNIVGILIILVMVVGMQVREAVREASESPAAEAVETALAAVATAPVAAAPPPRVDAGRAEEAARLLEELEGLGRTVGSVEMEVSALAEEGTRVAEAAMLAASDRRDLATAVSLTRGEAEKMRAAVDRRRLEEADRATRRAELVRGIEQARREKESLDRAAPAAHQVLAYPTPIGRTVNGDEIHFQIRGGRISQIPLEELFSLARDRTRRHSGPVSQLSDRVESVGPVRDFSLEYIIEASVDQARGQVLVRSREWVVRPTSASIGESADEALAGGSRFRAALSGIRPDTTVTLWCYPDSFEAFRLVREELARQGIPTAGRPLPDGAPIGGSAEGSRSVAQ
jgi:hypothetical protein